MILIQNYSSVKYYIMNKDFAAKYLKASYGYFSHTLVPDKMWDFDNSFTAKVLLEYSSFPNLSLIREK